MKIISFTCST